MKKNLLIFAALVLVVTGVYAAVQIKQTGAGLQIGTRSGGADSIGFWGATPSTQINVTASGAIGASFTNLLNELVRIGIVKTN